jgi:hypothetical protein
MLRGEGIWLVPLHQTIYRARTSARGLSQADTWVGSRKGTSQAEPQMRAWHGRAGDCIRSGQLHKVLAFIFILATSA